VPEEPEDFVGPFGMIRYNAALFATLDGSADRAVRPPEPPPPEPPAPRRTLGEVALGPVRRLRARHQTDRILAVASLLLTLACLVGAAALLLSGPDR
jgi:hypothetical protein